MFDSKSEYLQTIGRFSRVGIILQAGPCRLHVHPWLLSTDVQIASAMHGVHEAY